MTLQLKWTHQFQFAGYYAAIQQGYYLEEGLEVVLIEGDASGNVIDEVVSGRANFGVGMSPLLLSRFQGKPVVLLANIFQHSPTTLVTLKSSGYTSPQDLYKKNIRMPTGVSSAETEAMFLNEGVALSDLHLVTHRFGLDDLITGKVDAVVAYKSSQPYVLEKKGIGYTLISPSAYGIDFYGDNLFTSESEIAGHPERVIAFRKASLKGWQYALENPEEIVEFILSEYANTNTSLDRAFLLNEVVVYQELILPQFIELGHTNPGRWKHIADTYARLGMTGENYSLDGFFFQPDTSRFDWNHWLIKLALLVFIIGSVVTVVLFVFNWRLKKEVIAHQQTGKELLESEEKFRALFEQAGGYCMVLDPDTPDGIPIILDANEAACVMHGYSREEFVGHPVAVIDNEEGRALVKERTKEIMTGKPFYVENEHVRKDGSTFSVAVNAQRIDFEGKPPFILTTEYDITEKKRAEKELREREEQYQTVVENSGDFITRYDREFRHIYANTKALEAAGLPEDQYIGKTHREIGFPVSLCEIWEENIGAVFTSRETKSIELKVELPDGIKTYDLQLNPEFSDDETVQTVLGISRDITQRIRTEEELKNSILSLNEVVKAGHIGVWTWDLKSNKVIYSTEWKKQLGYEDHEIKDDLSEWEKRVHPDDLPRSLEIIRRVINDPSLEYRLQFRLRHKDGSYREILASGSLVLDEEGNVKKILGTHLDVTEQKKLEEKLRQAQKMESIGTLAGGIAHDFNNILSSVIGFTELALESVDEGTPAKADMQEVYGAGLRAKDLVKQILTFARQSDEVVKPIQVDTIVAEVLKFIRSTIPTSIEIRQSMESSSLVMGNATQLHQIVMNLCNNAAMAMEIEGGVLDVSLKDAVVDNSIQFGWLNLKAGGYVVLKVSDTGQGIESHLLSKIFEPYFTTKKMGEGTGMGLAMVHGIVETYNGKIFVESKVGNGTVFTVYLPVCREKIIENIHEKRQLPGGDERILLVDDEVALTKINGRILSKLGYHVVMKNSSVEAFELFHSAPGDFDLVISDVTMPFMTGDRLAHKIIALRPDIPIILCTGYNKNVSSFSSAEIGVKAFVSKPIVKADFAKVVRDVLDQAQEPVVN